MKNHPITADEARKLVEDSGKRDITGFIDYLDGKIRELSKQGTRTLEDPLRGLRMRCDPIERGLIKEHYVAKGFEWKDEKGICSISW